MATLLRCFLRVCCEVPDDQEHDDSYEPPQPPTENTMARLSFLRPQRVGYEVAPGADDIIEYDGVLGGNDATAANNRGGEAASTTSPMSITRKDTFDEHDEDDDIESLASANTSARIQLFMSKFRAQWRHSDLYSEEEEHTSAAAPPVAAAAPPSDDSDNEAHNSSAGIVSSIFRRSMNSKGTNNPTLTASSSDNNNTTAYLLLDASSFDATKEVLAIPSEQVVLPGSDLQQQMAKAMSQKLFHKDQEEEKLLDDYDECVICMEGFDPTNPRMPTLCGCGENKTYFHLPCLYQWIEQNKNCPSCRKPLRWEEFKKKNTAS